MAANDIARVYASSLVEIGQEKNILDQLAEEVQFLSELFISDSDFRLFLTSPGMAKEAKKDFIKKIFTGKLSEHIINFMNLLIENDRMSFLGKIYEALRSIADDVLKRKRVTVVTRFDLDEATYATIKTSLKEKYKKEIIITQEIDENILGGIIIKMDDIVIDGSLARDLKNIRKNLLISKVRSDVAYED